MFKNTIYHHSAGGIVASPEGKIALLKAKEGEWVIPKGHLEKGELPWEAALREVKEELNLEEVYVETYLCSEKYAFTLEENGPQHIKQADYYLIKTHQLKISPSIEGHSEVGWFTLNEAYQIVSFVGLKQLLGTYQIYLEKGKAIKFQDTSLTIGIPAKDPKHLTETLKDLKREILGLEDTTKIQMIVVSNKPKSEVESLLTQEMKDLPMVEEINVLELEASTKAIYLNQIFSHTKNETIVLLDDDILLRAGLLKEALKRMKEFPKVAIFSVNSLPLPHQGKSFYEKFWHEVLSIKFRKDLYREKDPFLVGRFMIIPKQKVFPIFEDIINEDQYLQIFYWPYVKKFHDLNVYFRSVKNLSQYTKRVFRLEKGMAQIRELYPQRFLEEYYKSVRRTFDHDKINRLPLINKLQFYLYRLVKRILLVFYKFTPKRIIKWLRI